MTVTPGAGERSSPAVSHAVLLFDGVCNLCNGSVQWLIRRDRHARIHYAALQSQAAADLLRTNGITDQSALPDSLILIHDGRVHTQSSAALRVGALLGFPWNLGKIALVIPPILRNPVYDFIARNRYRWFGRKESCMIPTPELAERFLDAGETRD